MLCMLVRACVCVCVYLPACQNYNHSRNKNACYGSANLLHSQTLSKNVNVGFVVLMAVTMNITVLWCETAHSGNIYQTTRYQVPKDDLKKRKAYKI